MSGLLYVALFRGRPDIYSSERERPLVQWADCSLPEQHTRLDHRAETVIKQRVKGDETDKSVPVIGVKDGDTTISRINR